MRVGWILGLALMLVACSSGSGGSGGIGGSTASGGSAGTAGAASCGSLESQYATALKDAKSCTPNAKTNECTLQVSDQLSCPCAATYVNAGNVDAVKKLGTLGLAWMDGKCSSGVGCPNHFCPPPSSGVCQADATGTTGTCVDAFSDAGP